MAGARGTGRSSRRGPATLASRALVLVALAALGAGVSGDAVSLVERVEADTVFARGSTTTTSTTAPATTTTTPPPPEWVLLAGGDVLMDRTEAARIDPFAGLVPPLAEGDLSVVNVEMVVAEGGRAEPAKEFTFRAPPSAAQTMAGAGIDAASLANNHARDFGAEALLETGVHLRAAGVAPVGAGTAAAEAFSPASFDVGDSPNAVRVAVLAATDVVPAGWAAGGEEPGVASARDAERLLGAVAEAKRGHDVVVVLVHWGVESAVCPNERQTWLGDALVSEGASVVLGAHPHVIQPVVRRGGGVVAYSLGNFVWHPRGAPQGDTGVLEVRFSGAQVEGFTFHAHVLDDRGAPEPAGRDALARIESAVDPSRCDL